MLEKEGIRLRALEASDLAFLYQWENDESVWGYSDTHNPLSKKALREYIESSQNNIYADGQLRLIIEKSGSIIGAADLFDFDARNRKAAWGLYISPQWRRQHVAYNVVKLMEKYATDILNLHQLYAFISENNIGCLALFRQLQYHESAILKDWLCQNGVYANAIIFQKILYTENL